MTAKAQKPRLMWQDEVVPCSIRPDRFKLHTLPVLVLDFSPAGQAAMVERWARRIERSKATWKKAATPIIERSREMIREYARIRARAIVADLARQAKGARK